MLAIGIPQFLRHRSRGGDYSVARHVTWTPTGNQVYTWNWPTVLSSDYIVDVQHSPLNHRRYPNGPCLHERITTNLSYVSRGPYVHDIAGNVHTLKAGDPDVLPMLKGEWITSMLPPISESSQFDLHREAFNAFADVFPQQMSFGEFLVGVREISTLMPKVQESMTKTIAGGYLTKKFGWDNFLSDLDILSNILTTVTERLNYLKRTWGVPTRLGFSRKNLTFGAWPPPTTFHDGILTASGTRLTLDHYQVDFRATCTITQTLDYLDGMVGLLRGLTGAFGLNNPIKTFWELCPLSFVVDWFFRISDHLDSLTRLQPATGWDMSNISCSYTEIAIIKVDQLEKRWQNQAITSDEPRGSLRLDRYTRYIGLPIDLADLIPPDDLSPSQLTLLLALLASKG